MIRLTPELDWKSCGPGQLAPWYYQMELQTCTLAPNLVYPLVGPWLCWESEGEPRGWPNTLSPHGSDVRRYQPTTACFELDLPLRSQTARPSDPTARSLHPGDTVIEKGDTSSFTSSLHARREIAGPLNWASRRDQGTKRHRSLWYYVERSGLFNRNAHFQRSTLDPVNLLDKHSDLIDTLAFLSFSINLYFKLWLGLSWY